MQIVISRDGLVRGIYGEEIDLAALGTPRISRASHVEPDEEGRWLADLSPVGGPTFGPFDRRSEALEAEVYWLEKNWLGDSHEERVGNNDRLEPGSIFRNSGRRIGSNAHSPLAGEGSAG